MTILFALSAQGCRPSGEPALGLEMLSLDSAEAGRFRKEFAIERGYRWGAMRDSVTEFVHRDWNAGLVGSNYTEWAFYAKKSPWRIAGWDEADPDELTGEDMVAEIRVVRLQGHYHWRRQTWLEYKTLSCEDAETPDRSNPKNWHPCDPSW